MLQSAFYVTTTDEKNRVHHFKVSATDPAPVDHDIVDLRPAGLFTLASLLTSDIRKALHQVARNKR